MPNPFFKIIAISALVTGANFACAESDYVIDQRDPKFQTAMEHLSSAQTALSVAQAEIKLAKASHPLPGLDVNRMSSALRPVEATLKVLLTPEQKRLKHQTVTPDGLFFTPTKLGD